MLIVGTARRCRGAVQEPSELERTRIHVCPRLDASSPHDLSAVEGATLGLK
jgi:hypothetical protein